MHFMISLEKQMRKASMKQSEWIAKRMEGFDANPDDVYDVLLGNITTPADFVSEVEYWARQYDDDFRRYNAGS